MAIQDRCQRGDHLRRLFWDSLHLDRCEDRFSFSQLLPLPSLFDTRSFDREGSVESRCSLDWPWNLLDRREMEKDRLFQRRNRLTETDRWTINEFTEAPVQKVSHFQQIVIEHDRSLLQRSIDSLSEFFPGRSVLLSPKKCTDRENVHHRLKKITDDRLKRFKRQLIGQRLKIFNQLRTFLPR